MYLDHLQNWLVYGHGLSIFLIFALFWLRETSQIWGFRAFPEERMKGITWNCACWCILTTFRTDESMVMVCWFFEFGHYFDLVKRVKFGVSVHFLENAWRDWPEIWSAAVAWPPSEVMGLWLRSGDFSHFGAILTYWNWSNFGSPCIFWKIHWGNGLKFCMPMFPVDLQNWFDYGYSLLIFLILMLFWLSETGQIWGFQAFWSCAVNFPYYGGPLAEIDHIWGFWALTGERVGVKVRGWRRHISDALHQVLSSYKLKHRYSPRCWDMYSEN